MRRKDVKNELQYKVREYLEYYWKEYDQEENIMEHKIID